MNAGDADRRIKTRFQSGLLTWLRAAAPQEHAQGLREMIAVTRGLAGEDGSAGEALLWRSAGSFLQALLDGSLVVDDGARALCRRLERHLSRRADGVASTDPAGLADALFAFVSQRGTSAGDDAAAAATDGLAGWLGQTLAAAAEVLPLLGPARPRRFSEPQLMRWQQAVGVLRSDWHAVERGEKPECRAAAIALLQVALELADPAGLRLAEALAEAAGRAEERAVLAQPAFRAAFAAAIEAAEHPDGPDRPGFDGLAAQFAARLGVAAAPPKASTGLVCASAPWFAEDAREMLHELAAALDAVPPDRYALLAGLDWFVQHESAKAMALRGLASTARRVVGQMRADDLDEAHTHAVLGDVNRALAQAVDALAAGLPPLPDEAVFTRLRALESDIDERRRARRRAEQPLQ